MSTPDISGEITHTKVSDNQWDVFDDRGVLLGSASRGSVVGRKFGDYEFEWKDCEHGLPCYGSTLTNLKLEVWRELRRLRRLGLVPDDY